MIVTTIRDSTDEMADYGGILGSQGGGAGPRTDAAIADPARAGLSRVTVAGAAVCTFRDGSAGGGIYGTPVKCFWRDSRPLFWLFRLALENTDHQFEAVLERQPGAQTLGLERTAAGVLRLTNFAGAKVNFALVPAANTVYRVVIIINGDLLVCQVYTDAGALIERQQITFTPSGAAACRNVNAYGDPTVNARFTDFGTVFFSAVSG